MGFSTVLPTDPGYKERLQCTCIYHHSHSKSEAEKRDLYLKKSFRTPAPCARQKGSKQKQLWKTCKPAQDQSIPMGYILFLHLDT